MVNICELTLKIKHLPSCLNDNEKEDFLKHFGAKQVKIITSLTKQKSIAYGKFESKQHAKAVLHRLHQLKMLDAILCVEYAEKKIADTFPAPLQSHSAELPSQKHFISYVTKINALNSAVGFDQPPPAHLKYAYPRANRATIHNISCALDTVPQFYFQVLHLMNRMNLPPPFSNAPDAPIPKPRPKVMPQTQPQQKPAQCIQKLQEKSDSESEIESDDDNDREKQIIPAKRTLSQPKPVKRPKFIKPPQNPTPTPQPATKTNIVEAFEKNELKQFNKIELIVDPDCLEAKNTKEENVTQMEVTETPSDESSEKRLEIITSEELVANQLPLKDLYVLPVFKDYHPGTPNSKLYIKNIAKTVTIEDLERIYKRYNAVKVKGEDLFEIKLMTEGRMKGQAFITMNSVELAQQAVKETNGFILKDKPLVVVFAKTPANKK